MLPMPDRPIDAAPREALSRAEQVALARQLTPLAQRIAGRIHRRLPRSVLREDVIAAAMIGVWQTVVRYGAEPTERLRAEATVRIRGAILDELRKADWLPRRARERRDEGKERHIVAVLFFEEIGEIDRNLSFADRTADIQERIDAQMATISVTDALASLPDRDAWLVVLYYAGRMRMAQLGDLLGISEPRVSQLHKRAITRLRAALREP